MGGEDARMRCLLYHLYYISFLFAVIRGRQGRGEGRLPKKEIGRIEIVVKSEIKILLF